MSIIFGIQRSTGAPVTNQELFRLASATEAFALDGSFVASGHQVGMGFQPFHTTLGSRQDSQPASDIHQNMLVFDGRLDNRSELLAALDIDDTQAKDSAVILAGFNRWQDSVFSRLIGEWALAFWSERTRTLYLARDHAGTRTLYFRITNGQLRWSTYLETFFAEGDVPPLDEEYASAFLCGGPIGDCTPYSGICAVPPAHYLVIQGRKVTKHLYWSALVDDEIRYRTDLKYEEHFFTLFQQAVARRTTIGDPVLAQLSGGIGSRLRLFACRTIFAVHKDTLFEICSIRSRIFHRPSPTGTRSLSFPQRKHSAARSASIWRYISRKGWLTRLLRNSVNNAPGVTVFVGRLSRANLYQSW